MVSMVTGIYSILSLLRILAMTIGYEKCTPLSKNSVLQEYHRGTYRCGRPRTMKIQAVTRYISNVVNKKNSRYKPVN